MMQRPKTQAPSPKSQIQNPKSKTEEPPTRDELVRSRTLVLGLGRAGTAMAGFLVRLGARVFGYDADPAVLAGTAVRRLAASGMKVVSRPLGARADWTVVSPGISDDSDVVTALRRKDAAIVDELDLASQLVGGELVAVTGTNGKSTTTALIAEMLRAAGKRVFVGGNLAPGRPLSAALGRARRDYYVVEVSSFQLERTRWLAPRVAVILNITADHLNRHRSMERYAECKARILDRQSGDDWAVLNRDDRLVMAAARRGAAKRRYFSLRTRVPGAFLQRGGLYFDGERVARSADLELFGRHNVANALAALCVARLLGVGSPAVRRALRRFRGLPHRLEPVRRLRGVTYLNNSMCTNPAAGITSLEAFDKKVVLITGGREKGLPIDDYVAAVARRARWVVLCGENGPRLAGLLSRTGFDRFVVTDNLRRAVAAAEARARPGDIVLFSPAFASFDQFRDFRERGRTFQKEVCRLG